MVQTLRESGDPEFATEVDVECPNHSFHLTWHLGRLKYVALFGSCGQRGTPSLFMHLALLLFQYTDPYLDATLQ